MDSVPTYGLVISPIIGAEMAAAVMALLGKPIIGKMGMRHRTAYRAVKLMIRLVSFAVGFWLFCMLVFLPLLCLVV